MLSLKARVVLGVRHFLPETFWTFILLPKNEGNTKFQKVVDALTDISTGFIMSALVIEVDASDLMDVDLTQNKVGQFQPGDITYNPNLTLSFLDPSEGPIRSYCIKWLRKLIDPETRAYVAYDPDTITDGTAPYFENALLCRYMRIGKICIPMQAEYIHHMVPMQEPGNTYSYKSGGLVEFKCKFFAENRRILPLDYAGAQLLAMLIQKFNI